MMSTHQVGSALVLDGERLVGIFTNATCCEPWGRTTPSITPWASSMTKDPKTIRPEVDAHEALESMFAFGFRHLPVVDGGRVVGIVSMRDVTRRA